jgi:hypothetical protein
MIISTFYYTISEANWVLSKVSQKKLQIGRFVKEKHPFWRLLKINSPFPPLDKYIAKIIKKAELWATVGF